MGKALYRKYRPKSLDTVVGQEHITNTLKNAIKKDAISHAYLFTGPRGVGKTSVARILAHEINDLDYDEEATVLDIIEIDAASNRRIDEIRDLRDKVHIVPTSQKYKVYIIDEVHMLTNPAFNALLKTLEEPPEHAVFILATTEAHKVPETIVSRTQRYSFKPISAFAAAEHLTKIAAKEGINIDKDAINLIAEHGRGSFRDSISMLDQISGFENEVITRNDTAVLLGVPDEKLLNEILEAVADNSYGDIFSIIQKSREQGMNSSSLSKSLIELLRSNLADNKASIQPKRAVSLMKSLLPLTGGQSNFEAVEVALLDSIEFTNEQPEKEVVLTPEAPSDGRKPPVNQQSAAQKAMPQKSQAQAQPKANEDDFKEKNDSQPSIAVSSSDASWNDVLSKLKATHNTLYGVLRMAQTSVDGNTVTLTFRFDFHKKQLDQTKNMTTLQTIVSEKLGEQYIIKSIVVKQKKPAIADRVEADNESLSSVSNIFGGAELLES